jgi:hypothetical protein
MSIVIGTTLLPGVVSPTPAQFTNAAALLRSFFPGSKFDKLVGVASRCTLWTLPERLRDRHDVIEPMGLWLALVWMIDDKFDQERTSLTKYHFNLVRDIVDRTISSSKIDDPFFKMIALGFERYYSLMTYSYASEKIKEWFMKYMETIFDSTSTSFAKADLETYTNWRLKSGAMMCVVWHLVHHMDDAVQDDLECFFMASLYISFQNDLLSYERDLRDNTPNLVHIMSPSSVWDKYQAAISHLNAMATNTDNEVAKCVLHGCYNWAISEPRYSPGLVTLGYVLTDNRDAFPL